MYTELNKSEWTKALLTAQSKASTKFGYGEVSRIMQIAQQGIDSIRLQTDPALMDKFFPFLCEKEQVNLRAYIKEKYDYVDIEDSMKRGHSIKKIDKIAVKPRGR